MIVFGCFMIGMGFRKSNVKKWWILEKGKNSASSKCR
jgi:hypothetical protein